MYVYVCARQGRCRRCARLSQPGSSRARCWRRAAAAAHHEPRAAPRRPPRPPLPVPLPLPRCLCSARRGERVPLLRVSAPDRNGPIRLFQGLGLRAAVVGFFFLIIILFFGFVVLPQTLILPSPSPPLLLHPSPPNNCLLPLFPARFPGALAFVEGRRGRCPPRSIGLLTAGCGWWDRPALRGCWRQSWPEGGEAGGADMCRRAGCERRQQQTPAPRRVAVWRGDSLGSRLCSRCVHCCQWQCSFRGGKRNCSFAVPRS